MNKEMTAVDYLMAKKRMHQTIKKCDNCPINSVVDGENMCAYIELIDPEEVVEIVSKWAEEHPIKTRQTEFLKIYPNTVKRDGVINICPKMLGEASKEKCREYNYCDSCSGCKRDYWLAEVEE